MARYANPEQTIVEIDGAFVPADPANADFAKLAGVVIAPYKRFAGLDVEAARAQRLAELSQRRAQAERAFSWAGGALMLDEDTQGRIAGAILGLQLTRQPSVRWQVRRGVFVDLSAEQLNALGAAAFAHVQACFAHAEALSLALARAEDPAAVDLEQGWPK